MAYLTAFLPMVEGVATYGVLHRAAMTANCDPDDHRTKGQVMADELAKRIATPGEGEPERPALELHLVMTDRTLADGDPEPAQFIGYGPVPAAVARDLVRADDQSDVFVRRLYTDPTTGDLAATDARRRDFPHVARVFLTCRDQICRTPWCSAPIRHADHALAASKGGDTDVTNGNGRCERCNLTKDLDGWSTNVRDSLITTTTPTGHHYAGRPPEPPKSTPWAPPPPSRSSPHRIEIYLPARVSPDGKSHGNDRFHLRFRAAHRVSTTLSWPPRTGPCASGARAESARRRMTAAYDARP
jgi:hypothetical protein